MRQLTRPAPGSLRALCSLALTAAAGCGASEQAADAGASGDSAPAPDGTSSADCGEGLQCDAVVAAVNVQEIQPPTSPVIRLGFDASSTHAFDLTRAIQASAGQVRPHADWWVAFGPNNPAAWTKQTDRLELNPCDKLLNQRVACEPATVPCVKIFQVEALVTTGELIITDGAEPRQTRDGEPVTVVQWTVTITGDENQCAN